METLEQFVKYRIAPPKALTQLYEQYVAALSAIEQQENAKKEAKLMNVLDLWKRRSNFFMDGSYLYNFFFFGTNSLFKWPWISLQKLGFKGSEFPNFNNASEWKKCSNSGCQLSFAEKSVFHHSTAFGDNQFAPKKKNYKDMIHP